jgi:hypothetical protein
MVLIIKQFLKPSRKKIILFLALFLTMCFVVPFAKSSSGEETKKIIWFAENYTGGKEELSIILSGFIAYFIAAYFISCSVVSLWSDLKRKKTTR